MVMTENDAWYKKLIKTSEMAPAIVDLHAFFIFAQKETDKSPQELLAQCGLNLISFLLTKIYQKYPAIDMNQLDEPLASYLHEVEEFISSQDNLRLLTFAPHRNSTIAIDTALIFSLMKKFPKPVPLCDEQLSNIYDFIPRIISGSALPEAEQWRLLYVLSSEWNMKLFACKTLWMNSRETQNLLQIAIKRLNTKSQNKYHNAIIWGAEYDRYYRAYLAEGYKDMAARGKARKQFADKHSFPQNNLEQQTAKDYPGLSAPALRRYHQTYLSVKYGDFSPEITERNP